MHAADPPEPQDGASDLRTGQLVELQRAIRRIIRLLHFRPNASPELMSMPVLQIRCLNAIAEQEGQKMVEVAARAEVGLPGVSRTVERLVQRGLVARTPDPQDRRVVRLSLTDKACDILATVDAARIDRIARATEHMDAQTLEQVLGCLNVLAEGAERSLPRTSAPPPAVALGVPELRTIRRTGREK